MTQKPGPRELQLQAMREANYAKRRAEAKSVDQVKAAVAAIPAKKPPKQKKTRR